VCEGYSFIHIEERRRKAVNYFPFVLLWENFWVLKSMFSVVEKTVSVMLAANTWCSEKERSKFLRDAVKQSEIGGVLANNGGLVISLYQVSWLAFCSVSLKIFF
jgi:hypothetical protein